MKKANKKILYLSGLMTENKYFEYQQEHTFLTHYRITNPTLANQISNMDGTEVEFDDNGAVVTIDIATHSKTADELLKMANEKKITPIGVSKRNMTGKARPVGTHYIPGEKSENVQKRKIMKSFNEWLKNKLSESGLGHELNCADWIQLSNGHWAGHNRRGEVFVSTDAYPMGKQPERFKFEAGRASTEEESSEYYAKYEKMNQNRRDQGYEYTPPWHRDDNE